jgi:hypothetical protein
MDDVKALINDLNRYGGLDLAEQTPGERLEALLAEKLNALIQSDFNALVQLLYKVDVSETRLRTLLETKADEDTGLLIARLILERQQQKILTRRQFQGGAPASGEERW